MSMNTPSYITDADGNLDGLLFFGQENTMDIVSKI